MSKNSDKIYVVNAIRYGNRETHSYLVGVFTSKKKAIDCAESQTTYRGGKYLCEVVEFTLNAYQEGLFTDKIIYQTKHNGVIIK